MPDLAMLAVHVRAPSLQQKLDQPDLAGQRRVERHRLELLSHLIFDLNPGQRKRLVTLARTVRGRAGHADSMRAVINRTLSPVDTVVLDYTGGSKLIAAAGRLTLGGDGDSRAVCLDVSTGFLRGMTVANGPQPRSSELSSWARCTVPANAAAVDVRSGGQGRVPGVLIAMGFDSARTGVPPADRLWS